MALSGAQVVQHGVSGYTQIKYGDFSGKAANTIVSVPAGVFSVNGAVPTILTPVAISVPVGAVTVNGEIPTVTATNNVSVNVPIGAFTFNGEVPTITVAGSATVSVPVGSYTFNGLAPIVSGNVWTIQADETTVWTIQ